ncbi:MAG: hypothetical protein J6X66_13710 [Lachnospiraceae bacterium]|nr:hypothetical protein [Lachnospiraceae bacterium]
MKALFAAVLYISFLTSCVGKENKEPEQVIELADDSWIMEKYFQDIEGYDSVEYERIYFDWHDRFAMGPTDYRYRGVIHFTKEQATDLWDHYEWEQVAEAPDFVFENVNDELIGNGPWYSCKQFENDNLSTVNVFYAVFDGNVLIFDVQQY